MSFPFPQELIDTIIDFLHDDKPSLYACSLVCRDWLETSRIHKFSSLTVHNQNHLDEWLVATPYLRKILLAGYSHSIPFDPSKCIYLPKLRFASANMLEQSSVFPVQNLEELRLSRCKFENAQHFLDFICSFPRLNSLDISQVRWDKESVENLAGWSRKMPLPPLKGRLSITESPFELRARHGNEKAWYQQPVLPLLASLFSEGEVCFQSILMVSRISRDGSVEEMNILLKSCGSNLKVLELERFGNRDRSAQIS